MERVGDLIGQKRHGCAASANDGERRFDLKRAHGRFRHAGARRASVRGMPRGACPPEPARASSKPSRDPARLYFSLSFRDARWARVRRAGSSSQPRSTIRTRVNAHQLTFPRFTLPFTQQAATTTGTRRPAAAAFEPARRGLPRSGQLRKSSKARARRQLQRPLDDAGIVPRAVYDATAQTTRGWSASAVDAPKILVENPWDQDTTLIRC